MRKRSELPTNEQIFDTFFTHLGNASRVARELGFCADYVRKRFRELGLKATKSSLTAKQKELIFSKKYNTKELVELTGLSNSSVRRHIRINKIDMEHGRRKVSDKELLEALKRNDWHRVRTAEELGLHRTSVDRMIKDRGLEDQVKTHRGRSWRA